MYRYLRRVHICIWHCVGIYIGKMGICEGYAGNVVYQDAKRYIIKVIL